MPKPDTTMTIAGREFHIGGVYEGNRRRIRRVFRGPRPNWKGWVNYEGQHGASYITAHAWARWAGEEISNAE